ncbi:MAG: peptidase, partial [Candidatus Bathyarchaeota archaeon]
SPQYGGYGWGSGCMGRGYYGSNIYPSTQTTVLTIDQAVQVAESYVSSLNNPDLVVEEVEEFTGNFYVLVEEKSTGYGAFELIIDKSTGIVTPEMGPNMMWNTKYSFNSGYCNWFRGTPATPTITVEQAEEFAQQYLDVYYQGTIVDDVTPFYGYYTFEVLSNSGIYGMLSVNSYTGQVWFHTWHGAFIQEVTVA